VPVSGLLVQPGTLAGLTSHERYVVAILSVVLQVLLAITSLLLTLLILLHKGRGGGLSDMFGGGVTSNLGASGVAERNLNRITVILGLVWIVSIIVLGLINKFTAGS
jgi:preprotein translocase subunit SecG